MSSSSLDLWIIALKADQGWLWDRAYLKYFIIPALLVYCAWVMIVPATQDEIASFNSTTNTTTTQYLYVSPEGVRMTLTQPLARWRLLGHSVSGVILIVCSLIQKQSGQYMLEQMTATATAKVRGPSSSSASGKQGSFVDDEGSQERVSASSRCSPFLASSLFSRYAHKNITSTLMLVCLTIMAAAGFAMRSHSALPAFKEVMILFVSPWIILGTSIYLTAKFRYSRLHVLIGNALVWSCFAVVVARLLGAALQRITKEVQQHAAAATGVAIPDFLVGWGDAGGYYAGITSSTVFFGIFLSVETVLYFRRCNAEMKRKEKVR